MSRTRPMGIALGAVGLLAAGLLVPQTLPGASAQAPGPPSSTVVETAAGKVRGIDRAGYDAWLGVPYATAARWKPPRAAASWAGVRDATAFGERCAQNTGWDPGYEKTITTEDCLDLNVYVPDDARPKAPVLVWVHGGSFTGGAGQDTDPVKFVRQTGAVVVTVNYRLGALGWLNLPELRAESTGGPGNYGLLDQQAALRWVRSNIGRFGGDPGNVTLAGQSAGATSVCAQLSSPAARGLFARAAMMSGGCALQPAASGEAQSTAFVREAGCANAPDALACLRARPAAALLAAQLKANVQPSYGGPAFPADPQVSVRAGEFARIPVLIGQTDSERGLNTFASYDYNGTPMTAAQYGEQVRAAYGAGADRVLAEYPLSAYGSPGEAWTAAQNDSTSYTRERLMAAFARWTPTYAYEFAERATPHFTSVFLIQQRRPELREFPFGGAIHVDDLGYLWEYLGQTLPYSDDQLELSRQMITFWGRFAAAGDPNGAATPEWPAYRGGALMSLRACDTSPASGAPPTACSEAGRDFGAEHNLGFWSGLASS